MITNIEATEALEAHRWENRLLLIFSPRADDMRARALKEQLAERVCETADRELVIGHFPMFGDARLGDMQIAAESAARIRQKFTVAVDEFAVILVGKDGYEKRREAGVPDLNSLFDQIDGMPMRRAEMRRRGSECAG